MDDRRAFLPYLFATLIALLAALAPQRALAIRIVCGPVPVHWLDQCTAGTDTFQTHALVTGIGPLGPFALDLAGPTAVQRGAADTSGSTHFIPTEIVAMSLTGGGVTLTESATRQSAGQTTEQSGGFRVDSFFDVFVELDLGGLLLHNEDPIRMLSTDNPFLVPSNPHLSLGPVQLLDETGVPRALIQTVIHREIPEPVPIALLLAGLAGLAARRRG